MLKIPIARNSTTHVTTFKKTPAMLRTNIKDNGAGASTHGNLDSIHSSGTLRDPELRGGLAFA